MKKRNRMKSSLALTSNSDVRILKGGTLLSSEVSLSQLQEQIVPFIVSKALQNVCSTKIHCLLFINIINPQLSDLK